jgi:hypothetical protein
VEVAPMNIAQRVDQVALAMLLLPPAERERCFNEAFALTLARHPDLTEPPLLVVAFVAAVYRRLAEFEHQHPGGHA